MGDSVAISVQNVSKKYRLFNSPKERLWETLHPFNKKYHREFWALKEIDFQIPKGTTVGIIGRNGSGKSTLLKIICSVLQPTSGDVTVNGRVSALLELGAGFNPEFTGRENAQFSGALVGFSATEMKERLPRIEAFADIGEFIDQPVKIYSSGMFARLAFATAIHVDPDILVVDEALSVGDAKFQHKCYQKFHEFQKQGQTIIFVSHDTNLVLKHCNQAIFIENGKVLENGHPKDVVDSYMNFVMTGYLGELEEKSGGAGAKTARSLPEQHLPGQTELEHFLKEIPEGDHCLQRKSYHGNEYRIGDRRAEIVDYRVMCEGKADPSSIRSGATVEIYIKARFHEDIYNPMFGFALKTVDGLIICGSNSRFSQINLQQVASGEIVVFKFTLKLILQPGDYFIDLGVAEKLPTKDQVLDIRISLVHINISYQNKFDGLVNLELSAQEITRLSKMRNLSL